LPQDYKEPNLLFIGRINISEGDYQKDIVDILSSEKDIHNEGINMSFTWGKDRMPERLPLEVAKDLQRFFEEGKQTSLAQDLLVRSRHTLHRVKHFRGAFLDAFSSAEIIVSDFLRGVRKVRGIPEKNIDETETDVGFSYKIKIEIPTIIHPMTTDEERVLKEIDAVRKIRNEVVHKGRTISEAEANNTVRIVSELHKLINDRAVSIVQSGSQ
jgi:hypothetical protein